MTNFFTHQEHARTRTALLVFYFILAVTGVVALIYLALAGIFFQGDRWWSPTLCLWSSGIVLGVMLIGVAFKFAELSKGGRAIAQMLGGRIVIRYTQSVEEKRLLNIVEEMAIASGVPVPEVYILDREQSINAFAAGYSMNDVVIGVTSGCVNLLTREELQGVIAHEFSHILNGDMSMNLRLTAWISGLVGIAVLGRCVIELVAHGADGGGDEGGCLLVIIAFVVGFVFLGLGWTGVLAGRLIQAAISRQREYLADASAVQFTRNPDGLSGALKKIASSHSWLKSAHTEEASHFLFGDGIKGRWFDAFSTHPCVRERLWRLKGVKFDSPSEPSPSAMPAADSIVAGFVPAPPPLPAQPSPLSPAAALPQLGALDTAHVIYAHDLLGNLPVVLTEAASELLSATALAYAVSLSSDETTREKQLNLLTENESSGAFSEVRRLQPMIAKLEARSRLPLVELAMPTLHQLSPAQFDRFQRTLKAIAMADRQVDLFEFALEKVIIHQLEPNFRAKAKPPIRYKSLAPLQEECRLLLSALAHLSHSDSGQVKAAFQTGANRLRIRGELQLLPLDQCGLERIDNALDRLAQSSIPARRILIEACANAITADGVIEPGEADLFQSICAAIHIPCPPLL